jgi:hypothetical protein
MPAVFGTCHPLWARCSIVMQLGVFYTCRIYLALAFQVGKRMKIRATKTIRAPERKPARCPKAATPNKGIIWIAVLGQASIHLMLELAFALHLVSDHRIHKARYLRVHLRRLLVNLPIYAIYWYRSLHYRSNDPYTFQI